jgi:hypothetical protein
MFAFFVDQVKRFDFGKAFSDDGQPSSSRLLTVPHSIVALFCAVYMTVKTGGHPDAMALTALGGLATVHYAVNRASNMFQRKDDKGV